MEPHPNHYGPAMRDETIGVVQQLSKEQQQQRDLEDQIKVTSYILINI
jgi:hypothetical protein